MSENLFSRYPVYELVLTGGGHWSFTAEDDQAAKILERLAQAMMLRLGQGGGRRIHVMVNDQSPEFGKIFSDHNLGTVVSFQSSPKKENMNIYQMMRLSSVIVRDVQIKCGMLLHGALAENNDKGVVLAGLSGVGKSTASRRLPPPWKSVCDETCLVVRDESGRYWAHPWPTWSRFFRNGQGGSWDVQQAVPLETIFFLRQSPQDRVEEVNVSQAASLLMESTQQKSKIMIIDLHDDDVQVIYAEQFAASEVLARAVPAYMLYVSLNGTFWKELEKVLLAETSQSTIRSAHMVKDSFIDVVFTGNSMNPTLRAGYLLTVTPYVNEPILKGDVIYFQHQGQMAVVHRVVQVAEEGIKTRGDNKYFNDPYLLQEDDIIGKVVAAQSGRNRWKIHGGKRGWLVMRKNRLASSICRSGAKLMAGPYRWLANQGIFFAMLPPSFRPKVIVFKAKMGQGQFKLKLMVGKREVGRYDYKNERWQIRPPFRLFVDQSELYRQQL